MTSSLIRGHAHDLGHGLVVQRSLPADTRSAIGPFVFLDHAGPVVMNAADGRKADVRPHPHIGLSTVSYLLGGAVRHRDNLGSDQVIHPGDINWMTAGRGIVHSELPEQERGRLEGFQLWLNLPAKDKMRAPWYRDIAKDEIPAFTTEEGVTVRVIAGASHGVAGAMTREVTEPLYLDLDLPAGAVFAQSLPSTHNAFVYVYRGALQVLGADVPSERMAIFANDAGSDGVQFRAVAASRAILVAGKPLHEPIAQYGPFVMNTKDEIIAAVNDFQAGKFGS